MDVRAQAGDGTCCAVWGPAYGSETHYLRVNLAQLRRELEADPRAPRHFVTEPGVGHRFVP